MNNLANIPTSELCAELRSRKSVIGLKVWHIEDVESELYDCFDYSPEDAKAIYAKFEQDECVRRTLRKMLEECTEDDWYRIRDAITNAAADLGLKEKSEE